MDFNSGRRNSDGVASRLLTRNPRKPLQGCEQSPRTFLNPGFQSKPWAEIYRRTFGEVHLETSAEGASEGSQGYSAWRGTPGKSYWNFEPWKGDRTPDLWTGRRPPTF